MSAKNVPLNAPEFSYVGLGVCGFAPVDVIVAVVPEILSNQLCICAKHPEKSLFRRYSRQISPTSTKVAI